jgi:hypothetical protein
MVAKIKHLEELDQFDNLRLECDGLKRVIHCVLKKSGFPHVVMEGGVEKSLWRYTSPYVDRIA